MPFPAQRKGQESTRQVHIFHLWRGVGLWLNIIYNFPSPTHSCETPRSCPVPGLLLHPHVNWINWQIICRAGRKLCAILLHKTQIWQLCCSVESFGKNAFADVSLTNLFSLGKSVEKRLYGAVREAKMNPCWRVGESPGRGDGVFATRTIAAGEVVSSLRPT